MVLLTRQKRDHRIINGNAADTQMEWFLLKEINKMKEVMNTVCCCLVQSWGSIL